MGKYFHIAGKTPPRIRLDLGKRPQSYELPMDKRLAVTILALVSLWGAVGTVGTFMLMQGLTENSRGMEMFFPWALGALIATVIIGFGALALRLYVHEREISIGQQEVVSRTPRLFGWSEWREPIANYSGLRIASLETESGGRPIPWQMVEMVHPDQSRNLPVLSDKGESVPLHIQAGLSKALGLPFLTEQD